MRYSCAALHHCAMKAVIINSVAHHCMNCAKPMHGALCGALFAEMEDGVSICKEVLSEHGQKLFTSNSAVICAMCIKRLDSSQVRSPAESQLVDIEDDEQDGNYRPPILGKMMRGMREMEALRIFRKMILRSLHCLNLQLLLKVCLLELHFLELQQQLLQELCLSPLLAGKGNLQGRGRTLSSIGTSSLPHCREGVCLYLVSIATGSTNPTYSSSMLPKNVHISSINAG